VQNAVSRLNNVKADVIVTATAGAYGALGPMITGLRTLGNNTPILNSWAGDELLLRHIRVELRQRPERGDQQARQAGQGGDRWLRHGADRDRRRRHRDQAGRRLDERREARGADGEVQEGADAVGPSELLAPAPHRLRTSVSRDGDQ